MASRRKTRRSRRGRPNGSGGTRRTGKTAGSSPLQGRVVGWAALSPVSVRSVYAGVAEVSVYVAADGRGQGVGSALLAALVAASEAAGIWTLQAGIFPENEASLLLHERHGFRRIGVREQLDTARAAGATSCSSSGAAHVRASNNAG